MLRRWCPVDGPGVVDKDVHGALEFAEAPKEVTHRVAVAEVGGHRPEPPPGGLDAATDLPALRIERNAHPDHVSAGPGQRFRDREADATARAGDNGQAAVEREG